MTHHKQPLWSRSVAAALAMSMGTSISGCSSDDPELLIHEAREWRDKGDLRSAVTQLTHFIDQGGQHPAAHGLLGELLIDQADLPGAAQALLRAHELGVGGAHVTLLLGRTLLMQGEHERLLAHIHAVDTPAQRAAILGLRAQALLGLLNAHDAHMLCTEALQLHAESPQVLLGLTRIAMFEQQEAAARDYLKRALATNAGDVDCLRFHADVLSASGQAQQAFAVHSAILERHPYNAQTLLDLAQVHAETHHFDAALACIGQARKVAGSIPAVLFAQALLYFQQGNAAQADQLAERILRAAPEHSPTLLLSGAIKLISEAFPQAEQLLQKFLRCHPGQVVGTKLLVAVHLAVLHPQAALALLAPMLGADLGDPELLELAGIANLRAHQYTSAAELLSRACSMARAVSRQCEHLALSRMGAGDYLRQIAHLERVIGTQRRPARHPIALATSLLRACRYAEANTLLGMLEQTDDNPLIQSLLGEISLQHGDLRCARNHFTRALAYDPAFLPALAQLRQLDLFEQKPAETTRNRYLSALAAAPTNSTVMENLSSLALAHQHPADAVSWMERACAEHPLSLPLALKTGALYLQLDLSGPALALAQRVHAMHPANAEGLCLLGQARLTSGDHDGACDAFSQLAAMLPERGTPFLHLAQAHLAQQQDAAALTALKKAVVTEPDLFEARAALVHLLTRHGRFSEALSVAAAAQRLDPADPRGHRLEGDVHHARHHYPLACDAWRRAFTLAPSGSLVVQLHAGLLKQDKIDEASATINAWLGAHADDVPTRLCLAAHHLAQHDLAAAAAQLENVLQHAPHHLDALNDLAWICQRRADPRALALAQRAHALAPDNPAVMDTLGGILREQGELTRALPLLHKAATLAPQAGEIHFHLGSVLAQTGDPEGARRALEKALVSTAPFARRADANRLLASL